MKTLQILFQRSGLVDGARHVSGVRRSGHPDPSCPCCGAPMYCIFSLDGTDEMLRDTPLPVQERDYDVFVCVSCFMFANGYYSRVVGSEVEVLARFGEKCEPQLSILRPYPQASLQLVEISKSGPPTGEEGEIISRQGEIGEYHRITPYTLWGLDDRDLKCPYCSTGMIQAMTIDTDENLILQEQSEGKVFELYPLWGDLDYLAVSFCPGCQALGYWHVH